MDDDPWVCNWCVSDLWLTFGAIMSHPAEAEMEGRAGLAWLHCGTCDMPSHVPMGAAANRSSSDAGPAEPGLAANVPADRRPR